MDNEQFLAKLNRILAERHVGLPVLDGAQTPSTPAVAAWASFLRDCVKNGIQISDPRWRLLTLVREGDSTEFMLEASESAGPDDDFKVGLQLLMGMFGAGGER